MHRFTSTLLMSSNLSLVNVIFVSALEFASSIEPNDVAHNEPPPLYLHCLPSGFITLNMIKIVPTFFFSFCRCKFCPLLFRRLKNYPKLPFCLINDC